MARGKFISYLRVSTAKQGHSGLGLEAQREAVANYLNGGKWSLVKEVVEIESGKRDDNRPKLAEALRLCKLHKATLVIAKLDRLARNVHFISGLMESKLDFVAVDLPEANRFTVHIFAAAAEHEARAISTRTKEALAAAKARGTRLGGRRMSANEWQEIVAAAKPAAWQANKEKAAKGRAVVLPEIKQLQASGARSLREIADGLNAQDIPTPRGDKWSAVQVKRILDKAGETEAG
jgi:DNA invertase Pin-like site-specific DNA recombinase